MKELLLIILTLPGFLSLVAQPLDHSQEAQMESEEAVEQTVTEFFISMRASDGEQMKTYLMPNATLHTVSVSENGDTMLRETNIEAFMSSVNQSEAGSLDEQLTSFTVHVDGDLSTAWMDYSFYYNGEFSHCGVNTMNLLQTNDGWKIFSIVDTRRQEDCL